jgi:putative toxin-antitoxin system antitoxin component (TIGR02293 family)
MFTNTLEPEAAAIEEEPIQILLKDQVAEDDLIGIFELTEKGFPIKDVIRLVESVGLFKSQDVMVKIIGMSIRTLQRKIKSPHEALNPEQSTRALRFAVVLTKAEKVFGSRARSGALDDAACAGTGGTFPH